jgi:hypothetical protein
VRGITICAAALACGSLGIGQTTTGTATAHKTTAASGKSKSATLPEKVSAASSAKTKSVPGKQPVSATKSAAPKSANTKAVTAAVTGKTGSAKSAAVAETSKSGTHAHSAQTGKVAVGASKSVARTSSHPAVASTATTTGKASAHASTHPAPHVVQTHYYSQQQPAPDRYREIQQALADKGYFHGTADGVWSSDSVDALKRFQTDQNLDADGKISALSLIALGLGPRRESAAARPVTPAPPELPVTGPPVESVPNSPIGAP